MALKLSFFFFWSGLKLVAKIALLWIELKQDANKTLPTCEGR